MSNARKSNNMNLATTLEQTSSLIEELAKTYAQIEPQDNKLEWKLIEEHFCHLQSVMKQKLEDLEAKEKNITEKEKSLAERETVVTTKEQELLDKVQELKDAAIADISELKVNCSVSEENPDGDRAQAVAEELTQFCENMDSNGLLNYITNNLINHSHICRSQLPVVLLSASEPTRLVLDAVSGFYPPDDGDVVALDNMRQSCLLLLEALTAFMAKSDTGENDYLTDETKQRAKAIADEWKPKLGLESADAANGKSLEARAFLRLLVTFKIASEFSADELCECVIATSHHRQASELCHSLDLSEKIPGIVEMLLKDGKNMDAVNFILSFKLSETYPPVPLLRTYLKDVRRNLQGNGLPDTQNNFNARELTAVKAVLRCVKDYNLEDEFPLDTLKKRLVQLQNSVRDKKRIKARRKDSNANRGRSLEPEGGVSENGGHDTQFGNGPTQYPPANAYDYPVSSQYAYDQANDPNSTYYHTQGGMSSATPCPDQTEVGNVSLQPQQYPYM